MSKPSDAEDETGETGETDTQQSVLSGRTLADLSVNAVPILIIAVFVVLFTVLAPGSAEPLLGFHAALVVGILVVSYVAARAITRTGQELDGEQQIGLYGDDDATDESTGDR